MTIQLMINVLIWALKSLLCQISKCDFILMAIHSFVIEITLVHFFFFALCRWTFLIVLLSSEELHLAKHCKKGWPNGKA